MNLDSCMARHGRAAWVAGVVCVTAMVGGCESAEVVRLEGQPATPTPDAASATEPDSSKEDPALVEPSTPEDASPRTVDADGGPAGTIDADDAAPEPVIDPSLLIADLFDSSPFAESEPVWSIDNHDDSSWHWDGGGFLASGPGPSCLYWGNRLTNPGPPFCMEGPAMLRSRSFQVDDRGVTLEANIRVDISSSGNASSILAIHRDVDTGWQVLDDGEVQFVNEDRLARVDIVPLSGEPHLAIWPSSRLTESPRRYELGISTGVWYRVRLQACGRETRVRVIERESGEVRMDVRERWATEPVVDYDRAIVQLIAEGPGKLFDDIEVRRGCGDSS